ncbi:MAG: D-glycero-beta-D-manno-heptose-7-phosphate kinase [Candidatus Margulisiibacteriota bacterium]
MMNKNIIDKIDLLAGKKILVVGDVMLDEHVWSSVSRISPEAPVPVADVNSITHSPGGSANVANNIVAMGSEPYLVGIIGDDTAGNILKEKLRARNISDEHLVVTKKRQTTQKTRIIAHSQHVVRVDKEDRGEIGPELTKQLIEKIDSAWDNIDAVLISDYNKGVLSPEITQYIIQTGIKRNKIVSVDPKGDDFAKYTGATIVTPNMKEAETASRITCRIDKNLQKIGLKLLTITKSEYLLVTRGDKGMTLFYPDSPSFHIPTVAKAVYDVTGAGDTAVSTLTLAMAAGIGVKDAALLSTLASGVVVGKLGTATVTREELKESLETVDQH